MLRCAPFSSSNVAMNSRLSTFFANPILRGSLYAVLTLCIWSSFHLASRIGAKSALLATDIFAIRLITAALFLLPLLPKLPLDAWKDKKLWALSLFCSLLYCPIVYAAFRFSFAAHAAILLSGLQPFLVTAIVWLCFQARPNTPRLIGLAFILLGISLVAAPFFVGKTSAQVLFGDALFVVASACWAIYGVLAARFNYPIWRVTSFVIFSSALVYLPLYFLILPKNIAAASFADIGIQAAIQGFAAPILAMYTYLKALQALGAARASMLLSLSPILTGFLAVPLLGEALTNWLLGGLLFVSAGSFIAARFGKTIAKTL